MQRYVVFLLLGFAIGLLTGRWAYELHAVSTCHAAGGFYNYVHGWCNITAGFEDRAYQSFWYRNRQLAYTCLVLMVISLWLWLRSRD